MKRRNAEYILSLNTYLTYSGEYMMQNYHFANYEISVNNNFDLDDLLDSILQTECESEFKKVSKEIDIDEFEFIGDFIYESRFVVIDLICLFEHYDFKCSTRILTNLINCLTISEDEKMEFLSNSLQKELLILQFKNQLRNLNEFPVNELDIVEILDLLSKQTNIDFKKVG